MVALGEVCTFEYGKSLPAKQREEGPFKVYGSNGEVGTHSAALVQGPGIVVGRKGSIGEVVFADSDFWPIDTTYFAKPKRPEEISLRWLYYALKSLGLTRLNKATGIPGLNRNDAYELTLSLPPLDEQKRIAAILDKADALRRARGKALDLSVRLESALFESSLREFTDTGQIEWVSLSKVCRAIQIGPFGSALHASDYVEGAVPVINPKHILNGAIVPESKVTISQQKAAQLASYKLSPGDVIMGRRGEMGRAAVVEERHAGSLCGTGSIVMRPDEGLVSPHFLKRYLSSASTVRELESLASGVTMLNLNANKLAGLKFPLLKRDAQKRFEQRVETVSRGSKLGGKHLQGLNNLFTALQHRAFAGEL
jgi:type I restriction enzyme S subunit